MSTNAPTSRLITYMHCHVDEVSLEVIFYLIFFQRNISIGSFLFFFQKKKYFVPTFFQTPLHFPTCFTLWILFQFVFLLAWHFQSSYNLSSLYTFLFYIKWTIVEKLDLNFFRELFWSLVKKLDLNFFRVLFW